MDKIDSGSLRAKVFNRLENSIISGEYSEGDSLNEIKIAKELGVSRTPVREALMQLELEGLVKNIPNKGAVVVGVSEKDIDDIYEIRMRIEGLASRLSARNISDDELRMLSQLVDLQEFYLGKSDSEQLGHLDGDFHKIIYDSSRSRPLGAMLSSFHNYIKHARWVSVKADGRAEHSVAEHRAILAAISSHNEELAERLTCEHIRKAKESLLTEMSARSDSES